MVPKFNLTACEINFPAPANFVGFNEKNELQRIVSVSKEKSHKLLGFLPEADDVLIFGFEHGSEVYHSVRDARTMMERQPEAFEKATTVNVAVNNEIHAFPMREIAALSQEGLYEMFSKGDWKRRFLIAEGLDRRLPVKYLSLTGAVELLNEYDAVMVASLGGEETLEATYFTGRDRKEGDGLPSLANLDYGNMRALLFNVHIHLSSENPVGTVRRIDSAFESIRIDMKKIKKLPVSA